MLLMLVLAAEVAVLLESTELSEHLIELMTPWSEHVAVDSNTWWHGGPVAASLAELSAVRGDSVATKYADDARRLASAIGDGRTLRRMERMCTSGSRTGEATLLHGCSGLSARQIRVLELMAHGLTNREIANHLSYSLSTVKNEVATVLRALGLSNRAQAARFAAHHRLVERRESQSL